MMSTMDGLLLMCASTVENDILVRTFNKNLSEKQRMTVARITVLVIGAISIVWGLNPPEMLALLMYPAWGILGLSFALCFYGGLYWKRLNAPGVCAGMVAGAGMFLIGSATGWSPLGFAPIQIGLISPIIVTHRDLRHQAHLSRNARKVLPGQGKKPSNLPHHSNGV